MVSTIDSKFVVVAVMAGSVSRWTVARLRRLRVSGCVAAFLAARCVSALARPALQQPEESRYRNQNRALCDTNRPYHRAMADRAPSAQEKEAAWSDERLSANPHQDPEKARRVREMFAAIARSYDLNNRLHSFGLDQSWRRRTVREEIGRAHV